MKRRSTKRKASPGATVEAKKRPEAGEEAREIGKDLMFEVLVRLPIKSLLRFKAVSKHWFRLISSSEFIKFRLRNACDDTKLLFIVWEKENYYDWSLDGAEKSRVAIRQVPLYPTLYDYGRYNQLLTNISHPMELEEESLRLTLTFVGSCSGLVCIEGLNHRVMVWNPVLRKCKRLPYFGHGSPVSYGFGYDEASDDFKVVGIRNTPKTVVKIYSARTNSWKKLQEDDFVVDQVDGHGCLLNGKLHWATKKGMIFTVDLSSERFGVMEPPDCMQDPECRDWSVHATGEYLGVFCFYGRDDRNKSTANLWLMKRYGVKESWTRVCDDCTDQCIPWAVFKDDNVYCICLNVTPSGPGEVWRRIPTPGHMTGNGITAFLLHSSKQHSFNKVPNFYMNFWDSGPIVVYVESLTWPFFVSR